MYTHVQSYAQRGGVTQILTMHVRKKWALASSYTYMYTVALEQAENALNIRE